MFRCTTAKSTNRKIPTSFKNSTRQLKLDRKHFLKLPKLLWWDWNDVRLITSRTIRRQYYFMTLRGKVILDCQIPWIWRHDTAKLWPCKVSSGNAIIYKACFKKQIIGFTKTFWEGPWWRYTRNEAHWTEEHSISDCQVYEIVQWRCISGINFDYASDLCAKHPQWRKSIR